MSEREVMTSGVNEYKSMTTEMAEELAKAELDRSKKPAVDRIRDNYRKEVESVDAKEIALKCIKSIRQIAPKVHGLELRESDYKFKIQSLESQVKTLEKENAGIIKLLRKSTDTINEFNNELDRYSLRIQKIEEKPSFYERICRKITLTLQKLKS